MKNNNEAPGTAGKPIKRHPAIVQFSREHHDGLLLVWKIRQGLKNDISKERIHQYLLKFFEHDLAPHFHEEENSLFPSLPAGDTLVGQALEDHEQLRKMIDQMQYETPNADLLSNFADKLEAHIRFEERELFNHLQQKASEKELEKLAAAHPIKNSTFDAGWDDHFWTGFHKK